MCFNSNVVEKLKEMVKFLQDSFISNLLRIIQHMKPKKEKTNNVKQYGDDHEKDRLIALFPGLAIPNDKKCGFLSSSSDNESNGESDTEYQIKSNNDFHSNNADDALNFLESLAPSKQK